MRANHNFIVLGIVTIALVLGAVIVSMRMGKTHNEAMQSSLKAGLEHVFDKLASSNKNDMFSPDEVRAILQNKTVVLLPSFVNPEDVLIATSPVKVSSVELLCVVKTVDSSYLGLTARREVIPVPQEKIVTWPHRRLEAE